MSDQYPPRDPDQQRPPISPRPPAERIPSVQRQREATRAVVPNQGEPPKRRPARRPPPDPSRSALYVPWWGFAIVILAVAGITCGLWALVFMNRGDAVAGVGPTPTPIFVVITATPTLGPAPGEASSTPEGGGVPGVNTLLPTEFGPGATATPDENLPILVGSLVEVFGTEGDGVAVRQGPGLNYSFFFVGQDGDRFNVEDGPRDADGYTWWQLTDPNDPDRAGWVVENFLRVIIQ